MDYMSLNLGALRCPDVMQRVRLAMRLFVSEHQQFLLVTTIEPSAVRDVKTLIALEFSELELSEVEMQLVDDDLRAAYRLENDGDEIELDTQWLILVGKLTVI